MRNYRVATQYEQKKLLSLFKDFYKVLEMEETDLYRQISISVFDHWLTASEANLAFSRATTKTQQQKRDKLHNYFYKVLLNNVKVYGYRYVGNQNKFCFIRFRSKDNTLEYMFKHFCIVIPKIKSILISGFDDTNHLYYQDEKLLGQIKLLAKKAHLHMI